MPYSNDPYAPAMSTANTWLHRVAESLGTDDRVFAARALRSWLHVVRDRVGVTTAAHLAAQLPELLRGVFYEGWVPTRVPVGHGTTALIDDFASSAEVDPEEAAALLGAVTGALEELFSPGQLDRVFAVLPITMRAVLRGQDFDGPLATAERAEQAERVPVGTAGRRRRSSRLESRLRALSEAVAVLARGLEELPVAERPARIGAAAQQAHRLLLAEGLVGPTAAR